jgi:hypothetical protein
VKEAMAMRDGHLLKRAGREFAKNVIWMAVVFGSLAAILVAATELPLVGAMAFVGVSGALMAAIVTVVVLWSGARDETLLSGVTTLGCLPTVGIGSAAVGMVAEDEMVAVGVAKAAFTPIRLHDHGGCGGRSC